ncbi:DUF4422 domain-containing protein [Periweissella cryptocerci]|uniref:DUF4422 domain-containing protein n=1 Tax=Periweissella cryptocerci TaxID=2506420 RepID=A0A4P6YUZ0_9LACO|nr:DUF4422 domain-containing protein [Periweissella cryptocerci]QBO36619.1 DUF4422 domain-containing protein [Periweissella cryptocerci]
MNIKILVAAHKAYQMPADHNLYLPVHVGKALHPELELGYQGDNQGDNISAKNSSYNELTAMYWAWKNLDADAIGLVHYRRHLSLSKQKDLATILNQQEVENLLSKTDIILPKKRNYYIESNYKHYAHAHHVEPLDTARAVLVEKYPRYVPAFDKVMKQTSAHMFNMFIMKRPQFDNYASWLFDVLGEVEAKTDTTGWDDYEKRVYGFVSELLLDVWLDTNDYQYTEVNFVHMEKQNWPKKIANFLLRKVGMREIQ